MIKKFYYKVVNSDNVSIAAHPDTCIEYILNEWVSPKLTGSKLLVFETLEHAKSYANIIIDRIYRCIVTNPTKPKFNRGSIWSTNTLYWEIINKARKHKKNIQTALNNNSLRTYEWPSGTVLCNKVKLIELINK